MLLVVSLSVVGGLVTGSSVGHSVLVGGDVAIVVGIVRDRGQSLRRLMRIPRWSIWVVRLLRLMKVHND
jgi:hypothetical protein